ncbi:MAG: ADP-glyceromanno-heptose 6-epimerase [bacterium]
MIIVTGGAGFIGSNLIQALNRRGVDDILVVDDLEDGDKINNLSDLSIADYMDKREFLSAMQRDDSLGAVAAVLHQGACADTMATDGRYVMENNFAYSKALYHFCARHRAQYLYASSASVYGGGDAFAEAPRNERALNAYAWSKLLFDQFVRRQARASFQCVGLRYFNVYGPREQHKGAMASVARHFFAQYLRDGQVRLFAGGDGYADGEQRRDFVSVDDIVAVNLFFLDHGDRSGIYNAGTGRSSSFNQVAVAVINACRRRRGQAPTTLRQALREAEIRYIPMPPALHGKYQSYTEADLTQLRDTGYDADFRDIAQGVDEYVDALWKSRGEREE